MQAYIKRMYGGVVALGAAVSALLFADIPAKLAQADKSALFLAKAFGASNPPRSMVSGAASHPWVVGLFLLLAFIVGCGILWGYERAVCWWEARRAARGRHSPICIHNVLFLRGTDVMGTNGVRYDDLEAVTIWLQVGNGHEAGQTLRGVRATLADGFSSYPLPIKAASHDLRDGELLLVEVGTVVARTESQSGFTPRGRFPDYEENPEFLNYVRREGAEYRLAIAGMSLHYLGNAVAFRVTVTADDVLAQSVRLVCDFQQPSACNWLRFEERKAD